VHSRGVSTHVRSGATAGQEVYVLFDIVRLLGQDTTSLTYDERRTLLTQVFQGVPASPFVRLSESAPVSLAFVEAIWARGGEGCIIKRRKARYQAGARSSDWLKSKTKFSARMKIVGYKSGKSGPYSSVMLRGDDELATSAKPMNNTMSRLPPATRASFIAQ
jgi:ATP-dependent DNA ligase